MTTTTGEMTIKQFAEANKVTSQAVDYAIRTGMIDAYKPMGSRRWAVRLTDKTMSYKPVRRLGKR